MSEAISQARSAAGRSDFWTEAHTELLRTSWDGGMSGKEIVRTFEDAGIPVTRSKLVAKANRLGLLSHSDHGGYRPKAGREAEPEITTDYRILKSNVWRPAEGHQNLRLVDLTEETCHWPCDDSHESGFSFCGAPVHRVGASRKIYCKIHYSHAYRPEETK